MVIPFAASPEWYAAWLRARLAGADDAAACEAACAELRPGAKDLRRAAIAAPQGSMWLTVPLAKGPGLRISDHGNWPHVHLGAINAIYGRTPYFPYLYDALSDVYGHIPGTLPEFAAAIHTLIISWLDTDAAMMALTAGSAVRRTAEELKTKVNTRLSILDPLFRFGKDTLLMLI